MPTVRYRFHFVREMFSAFKIYIKKILCWYEFPVLMIPCPSELESGRALVFFFFIARNILIETNFTLFIMAQLE